MDANAQLTQLCLQMVNDIKAHALELKPERLKLEARLQEIKARSEPVDLCLERIPYFKPEMSGDLQCPVAGFLTKRKRL